MMLYWYIYHYFKVKPGAVASTLNDEDEELVSILYVLPIRNRKHYLCFCTET